MHNDTYEEKVLCVAENLFVKHGYKQVSLKDIIAEVGGSFATLYKHFKSKEELFERVIKRYLSVCSKEFECALIESVNANANSVSNVLKDYGRACLLHLSREKDLAFRRFLIAEFNADVKIATTMEQYFFGFPIKVLSGFLERCIENNLLPPHDTLAGAELFLGVVTFPWEIRLLIFNHHRVLLSNETINVIVNRATYAFFAWLDVQNTTFNSKEDYAS